MNNPVVIGGIGGSGTRIVASILQKFNFFLGDDLNKSLDNLCYTLLFKRPGWYYKNSMKTSVIKTGLRILEKKLTGKHCYSPAEYFYLFNAMQLMYRYGHNSEKSGTGRWAIERFSRILNNQNIDIESYTGWGWKEPNTHLLLKDINNYFPEFKYIHTLRNGLDMAFSNNQQQLFNWGPMFGVDLPQEVSEIPAASFRYWVEVHRKILQYRAEIGRDKILILNFDKLCDNPADGIKIISDFLNLEVEEIQLQDAIKIPQIPTSRGRYKCEDISMFREEDLAFLNYLGFKH